MTEAAEFVDAALRYEGSWERAESDRDRLLADADPDGPAAPLAFYGCSVGAIRGTIRDLGRRHPALTHDAITALASELWAVPVYERRLAAVVLLQRHVRSLGVFDLTRIEGFVRASGLAALVDPLAVDVVAPLLHGLDESERMRARTVLDRWAVSDDRWLRRAADQVSTAPPRARR